ncbi:hypothetical protein [Pseudanabaena sp. PCC 6802]|uniref:hypothetical protein n=1 Tax=Pseudanabaena sp. PCC 6802 TaxID=118173 RepID=UPI00034C2FC2|nr:hypothetical protein [Pseudanabaena sp. PCC 6802]
MFKRAYAIGLLTFASFGFASLPALAQSEDSGSSPTIVNTSKQTVNQAAVITGDRNNVRLRSNQVNITNIHNRTTGSAPTDTIDNLSKQRINQAAVVEGNRNRVNMNADQMNVYNQRSKRGNHYGQYRDR